jgi:hypothetical protein
MGPRSPPTDGARQGSESIGLPGVRVVCSAELEQHFGDGRRVMLVLLDATVGFVAPHPVALEHLATVAWPVSSSNQGRDSRAASAEWS